MPPGNHNRKQISKDKRALRTTASNGDLPDGLKQAILQADHGDRQLYEEDLEVSRNLNRGIPPPQSYFTKHSASASRMNLQNRGMMAGMVDKNKYPNWKPKYKVQHDDDFDDADDFDDDYD
jgi:hypothetical protein